MTKNRISKPEDIDEKPSDQPFVGVVDESLAIKEEIAPNDFEFTFYLVVKNPFDGYKKGDLIFKDPEIQRIIDTSKLINCLKIKRK